jgi:hypothetical protein
MPEPTPPPETTEPINPEVRFERTDASVRSILIFAGALVVISMLVHLLVRSLLGSGRGPEKPAGPVPSLSRQDRVRLPQDLKKVPAPRLQINQEYDLKELRQRDQHLLDHYAWVDAPAGVVRIPIERAMELLSDPKSAATHGIHMRPEGK